MATAERKRPWYLVFALLGALAFGANGARYGWNLIALYREPVDTSLAGQGIADDADRAAVVARMDAYVRTLDAAKARGWPFGVATLLLGGATLFFVMRTMGGSAGARTALVQLVVAQAGLNAAGHWLLRDVDEAGLRVAEAEKGARAHEDGPDKPWTDDKYRLDVKLLRAEGLAVEMIGSCLVVLGLTRRRVRDFFESATAAIGER